MGEALPFFPKTDAILPFSVFQSLKKGKFGQMKATYEHLGEGRTQSILCRRFVLSRFQAPFHFHPELELTLIVRSTGTRFVGQQVAAFGPGDLVLLGANVPHCWLNHGEGPGQPGAAEAVVVQFREDFAGEGFIHLPELAEVRRLLERAGAGLAITGDTRAQVAQKLQHLPFASPFDQLLGLLELLQGLARSGEVVPLDPQFPGLVPSPGDSQRFQRVYAYLIGHYREPISLDVVAALAHLTPTAFCRYFKKMTRKTLLEVVHELRLRHAGQLLASTDLPVADVCFTSGFGNLAHFNKLFKKTMGYSPLAYRRLFAGI
jgi:AraC-like DNA-binding protein